MKDFPIIFSGPMVAALLDDRKTMTRRLISSPLAKAKPGDRLYVRENFTPQTICTDGAIIIYEASRRRGGSEAKALVPWLSASSRLNVQRPSIHMPRLASRLTLVVTAVRFERLQDISEEDARAEGIAVLPLQNTDDPSAWWQSAPGENKARTARGSFSKLWESLHGAGSWDANPELVAISFRTHRVNIDRMPRAGVAE